MTNISTLSTDKLINEAVRNSSKLTDELRMLLIYKEIVTGEGLEFDRLREYVPGDEARMIDWNSLARTNNLYTKIFEEERMLDVLILCDLSGSMTVGTKEILKNEYASIISTTLAKTALSAGDKAGLLGFSDDVKINIPTSPSDEVVFNMAKKLTEEEVYGNEINWSNVSERLLEGFNSETYLFIVSDFVGHTEEIEEFLVKATEWFKGVFCVMVRDPLDSKLPEGVGRAYFTDPETGEKSLVDIEEVREKYQKKTISEEKQVKKIIEASGGNFFKTYTNEDFVEEFAVFLDERKALWS